MTDKNIFVEGVPGSGKTTLLRKLKQEFPEYQAYFEGDISPVELAWCSYMSKGQWEQTLKALPDFAQVIREKSMEEDGYYIVPYTKIKTDRFDFYQYMEKFEIYGGRRKIGEFTDIVFRRYEKYKKTYGLFECSFFQNIIEELMLFAEYGEQQIIDFYRALSAKTELDKFLIIRMKSAHLKEDIQKIREERVNENGDQEWYGMMVDYLNGSPYGKRHPFSSFDDLLKHFERRIALEDKVIMELLPENYIEIKSKEYEFAKLTKRLTGRSST